MKKLSERIRAWIHPTAEYDDDFANILEKHADEASQLESTNAALLEALQDARGAIDSLDECDLGIATGSDGYQWPIKAELLSKIDKAIRDPNRERMDDETE